MAIMKIAINTSSLYEMYPMYKTDRLLYATLATTVLLVLTPNLVLAHTAAYNAGFSQGQRDKQNGQLETTIK